MSGYFRPIRDISNREQESPLMRVQAAQESNLNIDGLYRPQTGYQGHIPHQSNIAENLAENNSEFDVRNNRLGGSQFVQNDDAYSRILDSNRPQIRESQSIRQDQGRQSDSELRVGRHDQRDRNFIEMINREYLREHEEVNQQIIQATE